MAGRKENALDLAKFIDKGVRVKLSGGREGNFALLLVIWMGVGMWIQSGMCLCLAACWGQYAALLSCPLMQITMRGVNALQSAQAIEF